MTLTRPVRWLMVSGALLVLAALTGPRVVPLYDGVGFPDEPYRYVTGGTATTPAPTAIDTTLTLADINKFGAKVQTLETGPQLSINFPLDSVTLPGGASALSVKATPLAPSDAPKPGKLAGNVYDVAVASLGGAASFPNGTTQVYLRLPQGVAVTGSEAIVYRAAAHDAWKPVVTTRTGADIFEAEFTGPGQYAMATGVAAPQTAVAPGNRSMSVRYLVAGIFLGLLIVFIVVIRIRNTKSR